MTLQIFDSTIGAIRDMTEDELAAHAAMQAAAEPTFEERAKALQDMVQDLVLNAAARARGYDDINTAVTYASGSRPSKYKAEGQAFLDWRTDVWEKCAWYLNEVQAGRALEPTFAALVAILPTLELPE